MGEGRASGKAILVGEHAVVHGAPAIAVAIDRGARAIATRLVRPPSVLRVVPWDVEVQAGDGSPLGDAFAAVLGTSGPVKVEAWTDLPPAGGLGCSAALGVAVARAVHARAPLSVTQSRAMGWERIFHGQPSGVDVEVAARGGAIAFQKGSATERLAIREPFVLAIGRSGIPSSTRTMVEHVAALGTSAEPAFAKMTRLAELARDSLASGALEMLGAALTEAHHALRELGVSTPELDLLVTIAERSGALGAKLTGAGGGGCVLALARTEKDAEAIVGSWRRSGFDGFTARPDLELVEERAS